MPALARWADHATEEWHALIESDRAATPAHHPGTWEAITAALPAYRIRLLEVREEGRLLGGAPCATETRLGMDWLHAMPFLLPAAPLALAGRGAEVDDAVAGALAALQFQRALVGGEWSCYRPEGAPVSPAALARVAGETRLMEASVIDLDTDDQETRSAHGPQDPAGHRAIGGARRSLR